MVMIRMSMEFSSQPTTGPLSRGEDEGHLFLVSLSPLSSMTAGVCVRGYLCLPSMISTAPPRLGGRRAIDLICR